MKEPATPGQDHEFLHVDAVICVGAAVDDVHHRHGQLQVFALRQARPQRAAFVCGHRVRSRQRNAEQRIRAKFGLVRAAVQRNQFAVKRILVIGGGSPQGIGYGPVDVFNGMADALSAVPPRVSVPQFDGFTGAGGCA